MHDDPDIVNEILDGNMEYFDMLLTKYEKAVYRFVYNIINDIETSRDITQEVFITVYNKLYTYRQESKFQNWLFRIAHNKSIDYVRKNRKAHEINIETAQDVISMEDTPEQWTEYRDTKRLLMKFINGLQDTDRQIMTMRYSSMKMTFFDIAQVLNMTESSVKKKFYRIRDRFKDLYQMNGRSNEYDKLRHI